VYFRKGSLDRVIADPAASPEQKSTARFFLNHPWVSGAADFVTELVNPASIATGEVVGRTLSVLSKAPLLKPAIEAAGNAFKAAFDKYHPLTQAGGQAAKNVGYQTDAQSAHAAQQNMEKAIAVFGKPGKTGFGGTTMEEQHEILRRATGGAPRMPARSSGLTDQELTQRAQSFRDIHDQADAVQAARGLNPSIRENYFNMKGAYEVPERDTRDLAASARGTQVSGRAKWRRPNDYAKVFQNYDEVLNAVNSGAIKFAADYSPFKQMVDHLNRVTGNVAIDQGLENLGKTEAAKEVSFQGMNGKTYTGQTALDLGRYLTNKKANRYAAYLAVNDIARKFGISLPDAQRIADRQFASTQNLSGRMDEATKWRKQLSPLQQKVDNAVLPTAGRVGVKVKKLATPQTAQVGRAGAAGQTVPKSVNNRIQQIHNLGDDVAQQVRNLSPAIKASIGAMDFRMLKRGIDLHVKMTDPERAVAGEYRSLREQYARDLMRAAGPELAATRNAPEEAIWKAVREKMTPDGYLQIKDTPGLSGLPRAKFTDIKKETADYFTANGARPEEASAASQFLATFNGLFRLGILTNPLIHPGYNLLWAYLGGGGDVRRMGNFFRDNPTLDHEAMKYGAHAPLSPFTFGGNPARLAQSLPDAVHQAPSALGKVGAGADWIATRAAEVNRKIVFDTMERRMATEFWASLVAKGVDKNIAAQRVRQAFGDYNNMTAAEKNISQAFFFYPWTKAVIPFWLKTLGTDPRWIAAPGQGLLTHNENKGDPNIDKEKYGVLYNGQNPDGSQGYQSLPLPQKRAEDVVEAALPREGGQVDPAGGLAERVQPLFNVAKQHLTPGLSAIETGAEQLIRDPQEPGVTPQEGVMFNKAAPLSTQLEQIGQYIGTQYLPFSEVVGGVAHAIQEAGKGQGGEAAANLAGGYQYTGNNPQRQKQISRLFDQWRASYYRDMRIEDPVRRHAVQAANYRLFRQAVDRVTAQSQR
jgi:hypothetical protein